MFSTVSLTLNMEEEFMGIGFPVETPEDTSSGERRIFIPHVPAASTDLTLSPRRPVSLTLSPSRRPLPLPRSPLRSRSSTTSSRRQGPGMYLLSPAVSVESSSLQPGSAPSPNRRLLAPLRRIRWARFIPFRRSRLRHAGPRDRVPRPERTHARVNISNRPWPSLRDLN